MVFRKCQVIYGGFSEFLASFRGDTGAFSEIQEGLRCVTGDVRRLFRKIQMILSGFRIYWGFSRAQEHSSGL